MAINKAGGQNFQLQMQQANLRDMKTIDAKEASHAAQTGASGTIAKKAETKKQKAPNEASTLSEAAQKALDKAEETDKKADNLRAERQEGKADVADDMVLQLRGKKKDEEDEPKVGKNGEVIQRDGSRVFGTEDGEESFVITKTEGAELDKLDDKSPESILADMPEGSRNAASATLKTQMDAKGVEKVSQLKDDPKVTAEVEKNDTELADLEWKQNAMAPAKTPADEPPMMVADPHAEELAKEAAKQKLANGGGDEAMIAS